MRVWAIIWRIIYVIAVGMCVSISFEACSGYNDDIVGTFIVVCLGFVIINIPMYIYSWMLRDTRDDLVATLQWEFHPIATLVWNFVLAPVFSVVTAVRCAIQVIGLFAGKYDI